MTRGDFGRATEARFILDACRHGLKVSRPFDSLPGYDAVVDTGVRLFRVQIKGVRLSRCGRNDSLSYRICLNRHKARGRRFDVVAVWLDADSRWTFLHFHRNRHRNTVAITSGGKNARLGWEIFRSSTK